MPPSLSALLFSSVRIFDSTQKAKASANQPGPAMEIQMKTLNKDTTKQTPPGSPLLSPRLPPVTAGGGRTYSQYTLPQSPSSWHMQSNVHQNHHSRLSSSTSSQQLHQQHQTALQERSSSSSSSSRPSSRPASRRCSISDLFTFATASYLGERMLADTRDSRPLSVIDSRSNDERMKKQERKEGELEEEEWNCPQQEDQAPPLATADTTLPPSPLLTVYSATRCSSCSSSRSSVSLSSSAIAGQTEATKRVLPQPLYLDEEAVKSMPCAEASAIFRDQPVLTTPREFAQAVAWDHETCASRSYLIIDEDCKGTRKTRQKVRKNSVTGEIAEDFEMQVLKLNSPEGKRV